MCGVQTIQYLRCQRLAIAVVEFRLEDADRDRAARRYRLELCGVPRVDLADVDYREQIEGQDARRTVHCDACAEG
ncbi:hypothetical protein RRF57_010715 [Xylaria bambusicola]|uniref:Uncharacterized protein n=1 Tax=Xylaria bambusicola TaxID=326684 RepID=A0AAN7ZD80_9PEZI